MDVGTEGRVGGDVDKVGEFTLVVDGGDGVDGAGALDSCVRLDEWRLASHDRIGTDIYLEIIADGETVGPDEPLGVSVRYQFYLFGMKCSIQDMRCYL